MLIYFHFLFIFNKITNSQQIQNKSSHSHIKGLGINDQLQQVEGSGIVGNEKARKALYIIKKLLVKEKLQGKAILLSGPIGSGKSALAEAFAKELIPSNIPFVKLTASQLYSHSTSTAELITQYVRQATQVLITEDTEIILGEVVSIQISEQSNERSSSITLKTSDMESKFEISNRFLEIIQRDNIQPGDVISIDKTSGRFNKIGRSDQFNNQEFISNIKIVKQPSGELITRQTVEHQVSLHEMDLINNSATGFLQLFNTSSSNTEISATTRQIVDNKVNIWLQEERAKIIKGVLLIEESYLLDIKAFAMLNSIIENSQVLVIFTTNRKQNLIRGSDIIGEYGFPTDLLSRLLVVQIQQQTEEEISQVLNLRAQELSIAGDVQTLQILSKAGVKHGIRYALQLLEILKQYKTVDKQTCIQVMNLFYGEKMINSEDLLYDEQDKKDQVGIEFQ